MYEPPEDTEARKRAENGPPEDSAARALRDAREREHAMMKAALVPANAMHSLEHMELRKMRLHDPVGFAKLLDARIKERLSLPVGGAAVADIRDRRLAKKAEVVPPRDPSPRSPMRQGVPVRKIETNAISKHDQRFGDQLLALVAIA